MTLAGAERSLDSDDLSKAGVPLLFLLYFLLGFNARAFVKKIKNSHGGDIIDSDNV